MKPEGLNPPLSHKVASAVVNLLLLEQVTVHVEFLAHVVHADSVVAAGITVAVPYVLAQDVVALLFPFA